MRAGERTRQIEMSRPRTQGRDSTVAADDGEQAEHRNNERHGTHSTNRASEPTALLPTQRATDWDVHEERVEFAVSPGCVQRFKPFFKLVSGQPALGRRVP